MALEQIGTAALWAAYGQLKDTSAHADLVHEGSQLALYFTARGGEGGAWDRRYRLTLERGWPVVDQVAGPPE